MSLESKKRVEELNKQEIIANVQQYSSKFQRSYPQLDMESETYKWIKYVYGDATIAGRKYNSAKAVKILNRAHFNEILVELVEIWLRNKLAFQFTGSENLYWTSDAKEFLKDINKREKGVQA